ncbi:hypothetical protein [Novosphingobium sp. 9]|uniref:hypothetical protein n=1 Tax=Novosphingobium sp. 9 TaxID=2025349 RepID=UPI0021B52B5F|nr:hypothetical protein [Novosphingobium sp. 9]
MSSLSAFSSLLPRRFSALEPFVAYWAVDDAHLRATRRDAASLEACRDFDVAVRAFLPLALAYLDLLPRTAHGLEEQRLRNLLLGHAHALQVLRCGEGLAQGKPLSPSPRPFH